MPGPFLPLLDQHGSRSRMTCTYRCGNACDKPEHNTSGNEHFSDVLARSMARRTLLRASAVTGAGALVAGTPLAAAATGRGGRDDLSRLAFTPVPPNVVDDVVVPEGFRADVVVRWGDPILPGAPAFDVDRQSARSQARQLGYNCDYLTVLDGATRDRGVMVLNHEYTNEELMFPTGRYTSREVAEIAIQAHGLSVVELERAGRGGRWRTRDLRRARLNRRVTMTTPFEVTGPAAGDVRMRTRADKRGRQVLGTLNNCSGGQTPWGTTLHGEENIDQYFDLSGERDPRYQASYDRYGFDGVDTRGWSEVDERFDLSREPHEPFRFGWVVELDPSNPRSTPRKRTMLGRCKHEGANVIVTPDGRVAAYTGDDERGEYVYKFVSRDRVARGKGRKAREHNLTLLDHGTLHVGVFDGDGADDGQYDGRGRWVPLTSDTRSFVAGMSVADVLIDTRIAADRVGATRMDRPEDIEPNPVNGRIYCALTNNADRGTKFPTSEAAPLASSMVRESPTAPLTSATGNRNGYVLEIREDGDDQTSTSFSWLLFLVCGDPDAPETYFGGYPKDRVSPISCPDNVTFDRRGNLWISTDGNALGAHDGFFAVPVAGPERGHVRQFLSVPTGAETCGPFLTDDGRSAFVAVQHPGEVDGATFESPGSTWPHTDPFPRPSVVCVSRR
ncbi:PhoX family protein [Solicola sp. PLA-1-18]|uniref:PhoX family protein n=1 Tax=Solicola sp. PLA-1-18 TaxID=3380532 RepID=UPI003B81DAA1